MQKIANKYFEGRATDAELNQLLDWLRNKENRFSFNSFRSEWQGRQQQERFPGDGEESWNRLQQQLWQRSYNRWQTSWKIQQFLKVAAIFFFVASISGLALFYNYRSQTISETFTSVITGNGQISRVELPDGSQVWLNSGSTITYNNFFALQNRKISLTGEAFFDISENKALPLIVDCGKIKVKVLGTKFNVNAYLPESGVEVVLEKGEVALFTEKSTTAFYKVKPGERVKVDTRNNNFLAEIVNTSRYTSWKEGIINIYKSPIEEVVKCLEKRYNKQFELSPEVLKYNYTFTIQNETLEQILQLMERITPVTMEPKGEVITIKADINRIKEADR